MANQDGKDKKDDQPFDRLARILQSGELTKSEFTEVPLSSHFNMCMAIIML